jgi:S1-C subfamily serine protease
MTTVLFGWLAIRLWITYLPAQREDVAQRDASFAETVVTVQRPAGDLPPLEERVRRTAQAVLPSVVAVRNPFRKPLEMGRHQQVYASGVIITADGIVLSQWHVSHWKASEDGDGTAIRWGSSPSGSAGHRTTVILHDGRECTAELLGANCSHDVSLLRLREPGPYPHVPIRATAPVKVGDWVLKIGHPLGYRKDRPAPVRLGRVICGTESIFGTDYLWCGGDSGGPTFSLDGQLLGINGGGGGSFARMHLPDASFSRVRWRLSLTTGSKLIDSLLDAMRRGEVAPYDSEENARIERELFTSARLQVADYSQGSATLARYRSIAEPTRSSVVVVLNAGVAVSLGTIVGAEGWVLTKASELPGTPTCRLPDGRVVPARVTGVDPAFDLALLSLPATDLRPLRWADDFSPSVGTILAAVGPEEQPLAVGVVSVPRRDLGLPARPTDGLPLRIPAGRPQIFGRPRPISGYSLRAAFGQPRASLYHVGNVFGMAYSAGVRRGDLLHSIDGRPIQAEADMLEAVNHRRAGDVVPIRLERAGKMMDLLLPLAPETRLETNYRADDFPTVIECAVPFYPYESGGPVVNLNGRAFGVTIATPGPHGGMVIPGDCVLKLLPKLRAGGLAGNWSPGL